MIIDAHVYLGEGQHLSLSVNELLGLMDEAKVDMAIACPVDRFMAVHNAEGNQLLIEAVQAHHDRLLGLAVANPWFGQAAVDELRSALREGLIGIMLHPYYQGFRLSDPIVNPLLDIAVEFNVPVYAHTGTAGIAEPLHVVELARRYPELRFVMVHSGSSDYCEDVIFAKPYLNNIWLETSRNGPGNYKKFKDHQLTEKIVFGSSAPEYIPEIEIQTLCDVITDVSEQELVLEENIREVFEGRGFG
jgi:uncharacterized protein